MSISVAILDSATDEASPFTVDSTLTNFADLGVATSVVGFLLPVGGCLA